MRATERCEPLDALGDHWMCHLDPREGSPYRSAAIRTGIAIWQHGDFTERPRLLEASDTAGDLTTPWPPLGRRRGRISNKSGVLTQRLAWAPRRARHSSFSSCWVSGWQVGMPVARLMVRSHQLAAPFGQWSCGLLGVWCWALAHKEVGRSRSRSLGLRRLWPPQTIRCCRPFDVDGQRNRS